MSSINAGALGVCLLLVMGCSAKTPQVTPLSAIDVPEEAPSATLQAAPRPAGTGFLGRLFGTGGQGSSPAAADSPAPGEETAPDQEAETTGTGAADAPATAERPVRAGLFGLGGGAAKTPQTAPQGPLAFGDVRRVCGKRGRELGTKVAQSSGYTLYDSFPNSTAQRPHYLTGFKDGCAREFQAAIALFSDPAAHELFRYESSNRGIAFSATDEAYERIKAQVCGTGRGKPCGARTARLSRKSAFVTAYPDFGTNDEWANILLYNKEVAAHSVSRR